MVHEFLDYMGAAVGMVLIFVSATLYLSGFAVGNIAYNDQQNMAAQAQTLLDYILTSTGSPANWGSQSVLPAALGLQQAGAPPYSLDPLKLARLLSTNNECTLPGGQSAVCVATGIPNFYYFLPEAYYLSYNIPYGYTRGLIVPDSNFEFQLRLVPALNVTINQPTIQPSGNQYVYLFHAEVDTSSDTPVAGATINATFVAAQTGGGGSGGSNSSGAHTRISLFLANSSNTTDSLGQTQLVFEAPNEYQSFSVVATASVAGIKGLGFYVQPEGNSLVYVGVMPQTGNITVVRQCQTTPCSVAYYNVSAYTFSGRGLAAHPLSCSPTSPNQFLTHGEGWESVSCTGLPEQGVVALGLANSNCNGGGQSQKCVEEALVAPVDLFAGYGLNLVYGGPDGQGPLGSPVSTTLSRVVNVGGFTYIASLTYWPDYGPVYGAGS